MDNPASGFTIGAVAAAADVSVETIRFYQRKGLLALPSRPRGSVRRYGEADVARLAFIKAAQRLGFSLDEVATLLALEDGTQCGEASQLAQQKLSEVRARLADLQRIEAGLAALLRQCGSAPAPVHCPLISALQRRETNRQRIENPGRHPGAAGL